MKLYKSKIISKTAKIYINESIEKVFPLFSPLGEKKWIADWDPKFIYPTTGEFEENLIFRTDSTNDQEDIFNWVITKLLKDEYLVIYTVFTVNRIWTIRVKCFKESDQLTMVEITYIYTGLNELGHKLNKFALDEMFKDGLKDWEKAINTYLETGSVLKDK